MSKFGEVLREYISKNGYSINEFAGKCKIDRAWLSNVLSGRKELSEAKFDNILKSKLLSELRKSKLSTNSGNGSATLDPADQPRQ